GRSRIVLELLAESLVVAVIGGAAGLLVALWTAPLLAALAAANAPAAGHIAVDAPVLVFTLVIAVLTGVIFGIAPAWHTARVDVAAAINEGGRTRSAGTGHHQLRRLLVVSEIALATMLLVGAGLLTKSLLRLQDVSPGFDPSSLLIAE